MRLVVVKSPVFPLTQRQTSIEPPSRRSAQQRVRAGGEPGHRTPNHATPLVTLTTTVGCGFSS